MKTLLLQIESLSVLNKKKPLLKNISCDIFSGSVVGLFGGSGSGKSIFSLFIIGLLNTETFSASGKGAFFYSGDYCFSLFSKKERDWDFFRKNYISMVFQDPSSALNPTITCGKQILENSSSKTKKFCFSLLKEVGLIDAKRVFDSYPHELSGGQKQRVVIAVSLASNPKLLIADEPTTSLDPSTQREVLDLIITIKQKRELGVLLISHNLELVNYYCDNIYVLKDGFFLNSSNSTSYSHIKKIEKTLYNIVSRKYLKKDGVLLEGLSKNIKNKINLSAIDLSVYYINNGFRVFVLNNLSFNFLSGEVVGLLGESGSGKTTLGRVLAGLHLNYLGTFNHPSSKDFFTKDIQMVYQDPFSSFNPKYTVGDSVLEIIKHYKGNYSVSELFHLVKIDDSCLIKYPHELSGGQKQRVSIARALASSPKILIFDESISGLDILTQYSILNLIKNINRVLGVSIVFISHDIKSIYYLCDRVFVLKDGGFNDSFNVSELYNKNRTDYVKRLIKDSNFIKK